MTDKSGVGVTVIGHDSESRTHVNGYGGNGSYSRDIYYTGASLTQLARLTRVSKNCEQFIKYQCLDSRIFRSGPPAWWVSRDSAKMTCWDGASINGKCACGMTNSCADSRYGCNCDKNDMYGVKTAVCWLTRQSFLSNNSGLEILVTDKK